MNECNYFFQRYVSYSLPLSAFAWQQKIIAVREQVALFQKYSNTPLEQSKWYEIGTGSDLSMGLAFTLLHNVKQFYATDVSKILRITLINNNLQKIHKEKQAIEVKQISSYTELNKFNISYIAPSDARRTLFNNNSLDCITNTSVLEHIEPQQIPAILSESYRVLRKGGLIICVIDMQDHFAYVDSKLSYYNFLQYNNFIFNLLFNSKLQYQNRWRYPAYKSAIEAAGFEIIHEDLSLPSPQDLAKIKSLKIAPPFQQYPPEILGIRTAWVVARKR